MSNLAPGFRIGSFEIVAPVGRGGMGAVYRARHVVMDRDVALKVLLPHFADQPDVVARFEREARAAAKLRHPHIVEIYDAGTADGYAFIAMEYLPGGSLQQHVVAQQSAGRPFNLRQALEAVRQIASALDYAHGKGFVHRDIKPSNIMVGADGRFVVTDFGIVFAGDATRLTHTASTLGTPAYMSPEQALGQRVDGRSDQYALGVVLYELLTGALPFSADTPLSLMMKHVTEPLQPIGKVNPSIPPAVQHIIERMLAKAPDARFPSMAEVVGAVDALLGDRSAPAVAAPRAGVTPPAVQPARRRVPIALIAGLAAVAVILIGVAALLDRGPAGPPDGGATPAVGVTVSIATTAPPAAVPAVVVTTPAPVAIVTTVAPPSPTPTRAPSATAEPTATPTGTPAPSGGLPIDATALGRLRLAASTITGMVLKLDWSADGRRVAAARFRETALSIYDGQTGALLRRAEAHTGGVRAVRFSPDGQWLATGGSDARVRLWAASFAGAREFEYAHDQAILALAFSPDSRLLASAGDDGFIQVWDVVQRSRLARWRADGRTVAALAFSPDGATLASGGADKIVHLWDTAGREIGRLTGHRGWIWDLDFSPDGALLVSAGTGELLDQAVPADNAARVWRLADRSLRYTLPTGSHYAMAARFSRDGGVIAVGARYASAPGGTNVRFWRASDGAQIGALTGFSEAAQDLAFSPDGRALAVGTNSSNPWGENAGRLAVYTAP